jgi:glycosyltransferase involved in cell wall biosynthesis
MQNSLKSEPLVSVCVPAYNSEKTIAKTITSLIHQTYQNLEIIIIDNCSADATVNVAEGFQDPRIKVIRCEEHLPAAEKNWNRCFSHANGEFMAIFHADDMYLPDMISRQIETFLTIPSVGSVFTQGNIINENDEVMGEFQLPPKIKGAEPYSYPEIFNCALVYADFLPTPSAMLRRDIYQKLSPFRHDQFRSASDFDLWLRAAAEAPVVILDEKLMNYRVSRAQGSTKINKSRTEESDFFRVMDYHIAMNKDAAMISAYSMNSYKISKMGDQLIRAGNYFSMRDWKKLTEQIKNIPWTEYFRILIRNPEILFQKFQLYSYFRVFKPYQ